MALRLVLASGRVPVQSYRLSPSTPGGRGSARLLVEDSVLSGDLIASLENDAAGHIEVALIALIEEPPGSIVGVEVMYDARASFDWNA